MSFNTIKEVAKSFLDIVPVIMAGILGIYGLVVSVLISGDLSQKYALYTGFVQLGAGLSVGLSGLAAGYVCYVLNFSLPMLPCPYFRTFAANT